jgi:mRNA interferase HigB
MQYVLLVNAHRLDKAIRKHRDLRGWLSDWAVIVRAAEWRSIRDVRLQYPSADGVKVSGGAVVTVFNVKGNEYRLLTYVGYDSRQVIVIDVLPHAEYEKAKWKG